METIEAKITKTLFASDLERGGFVLLLCDVGGASFKAKGNISFLPRDGEKYNLAGNWCYYNGMRQFSFKECSALIPGDQREYLNYVCELTVGFGPKTADAIWAKYGVNWRNLQPRDIPRIYENEVAEFMATVRRLQAMRDMSEAIVWLRGHKCTPYMAESVFDKFKRDTIGVVDSDPYRMTEAVGVGFLSVDGEVRRSFGIGDEDPRRVKAVVLYCVRQDAENGGNTLTGWRELASEIMRLVPNISGEALTKTVKELIDSSKLAPYPESMAVALPLFAKAEEDIWNFAKEA